MDKTTEKTRRGKLTPHAHLIMTLYEEGLSIQQIRAALAGHKVTVSHQGLTQWVQHRLKLRKERNPVLAAAALLAETAALYGAPVVQVARPKQQNPAKEILATTNTELPIETPTPAPVSLMQPPIVPVNKYEVGQLNSRQTSTFADIVKSDMEEEDTPSAAARNLKISRP